MQSLRQHWAQVAKINNLLSVKFHFSVRATLFSLGDEAKLVQSYNSTKITVANQPARYQQTKTSRNTTQNGSTDTNINYCSNFSYGQDSSLKSTFIKTSLNVNSTIFLHRTCNICNRRETKPLNFSSSIKLYTWYIWLFWGHNSSDFTFVPLVVCGFKILAIIYSYHAKKPL